MTALTSVQVCRVWGGCPPVLCRGGSFLAAACVAPEEEAFLSGEVWASGEGVPGWSGASLKPSLPGVSLRPKTPLMALSPLDSCRKWHYDLSFE